MPSTADGTIRVFSLSQDRFLEQVTEIKAPYPIDNLSVDKNGDIFAATFPQVYKWSKSSRDPFSNIVPSSVFRIRKSGKGYKGTERKAHSEVDAEYAVEKVLEDDGSVLPGTTIAIHDAETGRYFLAGVMSPFITICEPTGSK